MSHAAIPFSVAAVLGAAAMFATAADVPETVWVYVGTYTSGSTSKGIYLMEFNTRTGALTNKGLAAETKDPSFLAIHPNRKFLYAVGEVSEYQGKPSGAVTAFAIDPQTGKLTPLNSQPSGGTGPCHIVVDREGRCALVANYGGGSVASLPIQPDGKLGEPVSVIQHRGSSVNKSRQEAPHAHSINVDAANQFAFAADLGTDQILIYRLDPTTCKLTPHSTPFASLAPGSGPRHFAFHPSGKYAYVINELLCTITAFRYDAAKGTLTEIQTVTTLPHEVRPGYTTAEVVVHPSGKFVYGSNRGHNSIAVFTVDEATGKLTPAGHQGQGIKTPRNFNVDPTGRFLLVGNQDGDSISVFRIDPTSGALTPAGEPVAVPRPVCIRFYLPEK
ncbi:MAG: lactonase family protein [Gemmatales bacterium]|nr:lactonase family protein [Gemmatales bacterium]MDW8388213.1 lactonase family protein [Gemmatales bacterium]